MMVFTPRSSKAHVISLRKANKREVKRYEAQPNPQKADRENRRGRRKLLRVLARRVTCLPEIFGAASAAKS